MDDTNADDSLDAIVSRYYCASSRDPYFKFKIASLIPHVIRIVDWYGDNKDIADFNHYLIMVGPILTHYVAVLGAAKDICVVRDGHVSSFIRSHDLLLELIHEFNKEFSLELMAESPKAYIGIDKEWAIPAKLCI
jgi:hypothetical protein